MTGSREDLNGIFKLAIRNYQWLEFFWRTIFWTKHFGNDLGLYAENYEPFSVKYWEVGRFGDSPLVSLQQATRH